MLTHTTASHATVGHATVDHAPSRTGMACRDCRCRIISCGTYMLVTAHCPVGQLTGSLLAPAARSTLLGRWKSLLIQNPYS